MAAYNVPALPLLLAQARFDAKYDAKFGSTPAYYLRGVTAYVVLGTVVAIIPFAPVSIGLLLGRHLCALRCRC